MVVTQESLNQAPHKYPAILEQLRRAAANASDAPLTPTEVHSSTLDGCGDFANSTAPTVQWEAMLGQTVKTVTYVNGTVGFVIVDDGVNVSLQTTTNFSTPVWAGACAGGIVIAHPDQYPQIKWALHNASTELESTIAQNFPSTSAFPSCGVSYFACGGTGAQSWCAPPVVTITPQDSSLSTRSNPASPHDSYIVIVNVSASVKVQVGVQPCATVTASECDCADVCGWPPFGSDNSGRQYATMTGIVQVTVVTTCVSCPLRGGGAAPVVNYQVTASIFDYASNMPCTHGDNPLANMQSELINEIELRTTQWLNQQPPDQKMLSCGCKVVCPSTFPSPQFGQLTGTFTTVLTSTLHVVDAGIASWPAGPLQIRSANTTAVSNFSEPAHVCEGTGDFYGNSALVEQLVTENIRASLESHIETQALSYNLPTEVQLIPPHPIFAQYNLTDFAFAAGRNLTTRAVASLYTKPMDSDSREFVYVDQDPAETRIFPPDGAWLGDGSEQPINGMRVTSEFLSGVTQLANDLGYFQDGYNTSFLDANLLFNVTFEQPTFSVASEGVLAVQFPSGKIFATCMNTWHNSTEDGPPGGWSNISNLGNMLHFAFTNVTSFADARVDSTATQVNLTLNLTGWDFSNTHIDVITPRIPLPQQFMQELAHDVFTAETPRANAALKNNPFQVPSNFADMLSYPTLHIEPQAGCCASWSHGYLEVDDFLQAAPTSPPLGAAAAEPVSAALPTQPAQRLQARSRRDQPEDIAILFYGSAFGKNLNCHVGNHGEEATAVGLTPTSECSPVVPTTGGGKSPFFYTLDFTGAGLPVITLSPTPMCEATCVLCKAVIEKYACFNLTTPGANDTSKFQSAVLVPNSPVTWDVDPRRQLAGPIGSVGANDGSTFSFVAWNDAAGCGLGEALSPLSTVTIFSLAVTNGMCAAMPPVPGTKQMYYTLVSNQTTGSIRADIDCASAQCALCVVPDVTSSWMAPSCKVITNPLHEAVLPIPSVALRVFPIPPPTHAPTLAPPTPPPTWPTPAPVAPPTPPAPSAGAIAATVVEVIAALTAVGLVCYGVITSRNRRKALAAAGNSGSINDDGAESTALINPAITRGLQCLYQQARVGSARALAFARAKRRACSDCAYAALVWTRDLTLAFVARARRCAIAAAVAAAAGAKKLARATRDRLQCHEQPPAVMRQATVLLGFSGVLAVALFVAWECADPFAIFTSTLLSRVGLSGDHLSAGRVAENFARWSAFGRACTLFLALACLALAARVHFWRTFHLAMPTLWAGTFFFLAGILLPPFTFFFDEGFVFYPGPNSTLARSDSGFTKDIERFIGTGFASAAFSWFGILFCVVALGVPAGSFFGSVSFQFNVMSGVLSDGDVLAIQFGRLDIVLWLSHVTAPLTQILSVIVLYQVSGETSVFMFVWFALWVSSLWFVRRVTLLSRKDARMTAARKLVLTRRYAVAYAFVSTSCLAAVLGMLSNLLSGRQYVYFALLMAVSVVMWTAVFFIALHRDYQIDRELLAPVDCSDCGADATRCCYCGSCGAWVRRGRAVGLPRADPRRRGRAATGLSNVGDGGVGGDHDGDGGGDDDDDPLIQVNSMGSVNAARAPIYEGDDPPHDTAGVSPLQARAEPAGGTPATEARVCCGQPVSGGRYCTWCGSGGGVSDEAELATDANGNVLSAAEANVDDESDNDSNSGDGASNALPHRDPRIVAAASALWAFIMEAEEQKRPQLYGKRLPGRRAWLLLAVITLGVYLFQAFRKDLSETPQDRLAGMIENFDQSLTWPQNGTAFTNILDAYGTATLQSDYICITGWCVLLLAAFVEVVMVPGAGLPMSQALTIAGASLLFVGVILPAFPNYVVDLGFDEVFPFCAPEFNRFVDRLIRNLVGLACSGFFAAALFVMLLSVSPALVRVAKYVVVDTHLGDWVSFSSAMHMQVFKRNMLLVMGAGSMLAPLLCLLPMLIFYQFYGDTLTGAMFVAFSLLPIVAAFSATTDLIYPAYIGYFLWYFGPLAVVLWAEANKHHFAGVVRRQLRNPMTYVEIAAEISLANVVVSDVIYVSLEKDY